MKFTIDIVKALRRKPPGPPWKEKRVSAAIFIALTTLLLLGIGFVYMRASTPLDREIRMNRRQKSYLIDQLSKVGKELEDARKELGLLSTPRVQRVEWTGKLVDLSTIVPGDLWLTDLSMKNIKKMVRGSKAVQLETYLIIKGATESTSGRKPLNSISQFISSLNRLESFGRHFEPIQLVSTRLSRRKDRELVEFEISGKIKHHSSVAGRKES